MKKLTLHNLGILMYLIGLSIFITALFYPAGLIKNILLLSSFVLSGYDIIIHGFIKTYKSSKIAKSFKPNIHILMTLGAFGAIIINEYLEAAVLIIIFAGAHFIEHLIESRSRKEITKLINLNPQSAHLLINGEVIEVEIDEVNIGDTIRVLNGDMVPLDGEIISGITTIDQSSITGESIPVTKRAGDIVYASTINGNGTIDILVTKNSSETLFSQIVEMVKNAQKNISKTAAFIKRFEPIYVNIILLLTPLFYLLMYYVFKLSFNESFYRTMIFLIVTSPCALAATDIPASLSAISNLARSGILFKGGRYISNLNDINTIAFDKTGTLTNGKPIVTDFVYEKNLSTEELKLYKRLIYSMELQANHPLAYAITNYFKDEKQLEIIVDNIIGEGLIAEYNDNKYLLGKITLFNDLSENLNNYKKQLSGDGKTVIYFGKEERPVIIIGVFDTPKDSAKDTIEYFNKEKIKTVMITGDNEETALAVAKDLGIKEVKATVLPNQKANIITSLKENSGVVAMVGDGVNDAPALATSDVGIALKQGTDIAIDVSDAVIMNNDLTSIVYAHKLSRKTRKVIVQNIVFAMSIVLFLIILNILGLMKMNYAVSVHEGSTIIVILNGLRLLKKL